MVLLCKEEVFIFKKLKRQKRKNWVAFSRSAAHWLRLYEEMEISERENFEKNFEVYNVTKLFIEILQ